MASTYSDKLRLELMATGEKSGEWGSVTNTNLGTLLEEAIAGVYTVTMTSDADYTLTSLNGASDEARQAVLVVESAVSLTATRNLLIPQKDKVYIVKNNTSGGRLLVVKTTVGTGVTLTSGDTQILYCDGTNVYSGVDSLPTGTTIDGAAILTTTAAQTVSNKTIQQSTVDETVIGGVTPAAGTFTTLTVNDSTTLNGTTIPANKTLVTTDDTQSLSNKTLSNGGGSAPFSVGSTVKVTNLNADLLDGKSAPSGAILGTTDTQSVSNKTITSSSVNSTPIGASSASTGTFTTLTSNNTTTLNGTTIPASKTLVTTADTQTLTNKTLTSPTISGLALSDSSIVFEGSVADSFETTLTVVNPTADRTITLPNVSGTVALNEPAIIYSPDGLGGYIPTLATGITAAEIRTLIDAGQSQFSGAWNDLSDVPAVISNISETGMIFEGATANNFETTLSITDPTADRTITFPNATGTVALTSDIPTTLPFSSITSTPTTLSGYGITGTNSLTGSLQVDNLKLDLNTLSSTDSNGNITLAPNGSGTVVIDTTGNENNLVIRSTYADDVPDGVDDDDEVAPDLVLYRDTPSQDLATLGSVIFRGNDSTGTAADYARIASQVRENTAAALSGDLILERHVNGSSLQQTGLLLHGDGSARLYFSTSSSSTEQIKTVEYGSNINNRLRYYIGEAVVLSMIASSGVITPDSSITVGMQYSVMSHTLTSSVTLAFPTTVVAGTGGLFIFTQDSTGGRTVSLGSGYVVANGGGLTIDSGSNAITVVPWHAIRTDLILLGAPQVNFS